MKRRDFIATLAAGALYSRPTHAFAPLNIAFPQTPPYLKLAEFVEPGHDQFKNEKEAQAIEARLAAWARGGALPIASECRGRSPLPERYEPIANDVAHAVYGRATDVADGCRRWLNSLGEIRFARFYSLPENIVRYDVRSRNHGRLEHRIGIWRQEWTAGKLASLEPLEETLVTADVPWFRDVTAHAFRDEPAFNEQLTRGVPYWRSRLDPALGIDLYGQNGVAAADIDGDGLDEFYVCQPGGLPNRLFRNDGRGNLRDIAKECGLDILDETACALFVDLRNSGAQDLVLVRSSRPLLFLNDGKGHFELAPEAFHFATPPQGSFTSVAAADYDRDGRLDLYFCCYVYYQNEAQYRYPVPYHDSRTGPPNFLFRNRLHESPTRFEDVTASSGINHNNDRFSFAATWCDFNGDGWPDLYVTNDFGRKNLYLNENGKFRDVAEQAGVTDLGPGMSAAWLDYDGDGRPDLLVSNMWSAAGQRIVNDAAFGPVQKDSSLLAAYQAHVKGNSLYRNNGDCTFRYTGHEQGIEVCPWAWSCDGADFDSDGSPELYVACGMTGNNSSMDLMSFFYRQVVSQSPPKQEPSPAYENGWNTINQLVREDFSWASPEPNVFFARRGGRYYDFSGVSGLDVADDSRAFAFADIDGDGRLDVVLKSRRGPQVRVYQNQRASSRASLVLSLRGTKSNRDAIGARVEVDGRVQWLTAGSGYLSQHTKHLHFGLGERGHASLVRITWPSGATQEFPKLEANHRYEITEGSDRVASHALAAPQPLPDTSVASDNRARLITTWLWEPVPLPETRHTAGLLVVHAGEPIPENVAAADQLDLRTNSDLAGAYAIFRRYLFDYRAALETPLYLLIDRYSRVRKVYAEAPSRTMWEADLRSVTDNLPERRALPFPGKYLGSARRDYYKFGGALLEAGYPEPALPYLEELIRRSPDNARAMVAVARIHLLADRLDPARRQLERAIALDPRLPEAWNELGGVESKAQRYERAIDAYQKALVLAPQTAYIRMNTASALEHLGQTEKAEQLLRDLLRAEPGNSDAANALGQLLAEHDRSSEAKVLFQRAIANRRDDASAINNLAVLYMKLGQTDDAIAAFRYGIETVPQDETLPLNLTRVYIQSGNRDKAVEVMRQLLARKPGSAVARKALAELEAQ